METQLLLTNEGTSIVDTTILKIVEVVDNLLAAQSLSQSGAIERPCVDMGIDTKVGSCSVEERLTLLPCRTGSDESGADLIDVALGQCSSTELSLGIN